MALMTADRGVRTLLALCAGFLSMALLLLAQSVLAPVSFALFTIAIVWPLQRFLQARMPKILAVIITLLLTLVSILALASTVAWGFTRVGQWLLANSDRFQALYARTAEYLETHGVYLAGLWAEHFDVRWLARVFQEFSVQLQSLLSFSIVTFVFVILGLLEVDVTAQKLRGLGDRALGQSLLDAGSETAWKFQKYMLIRTLMSVVTGVIVWAFARISGLELALEWGVIAFALNYIPFLGPLIATVLPTLFAVAQFGSWEMAVLVLVSLNVIQFVTGSYIEPIIAGKTVSLSPFIVLFAVFFWSLLWGIAGAFIGIPITIAIVTLCAYYPSSRWVASLLSAEAEPTPAD